MLTLDFVVSQIYCVLATNTPSERNFPVAGFTVNIRRSQIRFDNVDNVIFIHNNYIYLKELILTLILIIFFIN